VSTPAQDRSTQLRTDLESLRIERGAAAPVRARRGFRRLGTVVAIAILGVLAFLGVQRLSGGAIDVRVARGTTAPSGSDVLLPVLSGSGYIVTGERYISIGVRVPGRINRYFVEEGQAVRANDPLVQLDDRDYQAIVARTEAGLRVAQANRSLADAELGRGRELRANKVISQQELDVFENKAAVARATEMQVQAELTQAKINLEYTTLRAPGDGVVLAKLKEVGEIAVPGGFAGSGDLIRLANLTDIRAEIDVNESDLSRVRMGQPAYVIPDAYSDVRYPAEVVKMYPQVDRQKGTLKIEVQVKKPDVRLLPDMSVRVSFLQPLTDEQARQPALMLPAAAVRRDSSEQSFVWTVDNGHARRVDVSVAGQIGDQVRASGALTPESTVVVSEDGDLKDGAAVRVADRAA
jgi:HlyD family secretion protein